MEQGIFRDAKDTNMTRRAQLYHEKVEGHKVLDRIHERYGITRDAIYVMLAKRLNVPEPMAHFSNMHSYIEVRRATEVLRHIEAAQYRKEARLERKAAKGDVVLGVHKTRALLAVTAAENARRARIQRFPRFVRPLVEHFV